MLKILQARLQQSMNRELSDVQTGFRKGRGTRDQIANICWITEKVRETPKKIYFCFTDYTIGFHYIGTEIRSVVSRECVLQQGNDPRETGKSL